MIRLKQLLYENQIDQCDFYPKTGWGWRAFNQALNGLMPKTVDKFINDVEAAVRDTPILMRSLGKSGLDISAIWDKTSNTNVRLRNTTSTRCKISDGLYGLERTPAIILGDPTHVNSKHEEAEMITPAALKQFKLFRSPFINDVNDVKDIFMSEEHRFLQMMMIDTARYAGFTAIFGEVGSGKSIMRKAVVHELMAEDVKVILPLIIDKKRITPASLVDAIIFDISEEKPKRGLEAKTRQAMKCLRNRAKSGMKQVLIIEEAHLLSVAAMKALKQIYELENGYSKMIGIILIGQPELSSLLDETQHPEMREVTRRVTCAEISGLGKELKSYLTHKIKRAGKKSDDIFCADAYDAISRRLRDKVGRKTISKAYPLTVNNLVSRAMNLAAEIGEPKVSAELIMGV